MGSSSGPTGLSRLSYRASSNAISLISGTKHCHNVWLPIGPRCTLQPAVLQLTLLSTLRFAYLWDYYHLSVRLKLTLSGYVRNTSERLRVAFQSVQEHMSRAKHSQKGYYDRQSRIPEYRNGDRVWLHRPRLPAGAPRKFHREWQGPYEVVFVRSPTVCASKRYGPKRRRTDRSLQPTETDGTVFKFYACRWNRATRLSPGSRTHCRCASLGVPRFGSRCAGTGDSASLRRGDNVVQLKPQCIV
ncbi:unnamed protein product [Dicrocoelium dendriticum]|nr:unnamed protein product [Dicrocoelium dendriticum]